MSSSKAKYSLGGSFLSIVSGVVSCGFILLIIIGTISQKTLLYEVYEKNSVSKAKIVSHSLSQALERRNTTLIQELYEEYFSGTSVTSASLYDMLSREVISYSSAEGEQSYNVSQDKEFFDKVAKNQKLYIEKKGDHLNIGMPVYSQNIPDAIIGYIGLSYNLDVIDNKVKKTVTEQSVLLLGIMFAILWLLKVSLTSIIINPLKSITGLIEKIAAGDTSISIPARNKNDELDIMINTFNNLLSQIEERDQILIKTNQQILKESATISLLQKTAVAANEAKTIEEALKNAIMNICNYARWPIGHAYIYDSTHQRLVSSNIWHIDDQDKFKEFKEESENMVFTKGTGLPGMVMNQLSPVWVENLANYEDFKRDKVAASLGIKSATAFPIIANGNVWAVLEFFANRYKRKDIHLLNVFDSISVQLNRVIERKQSEQTLEASKEAAESANLAKSEFLTNMSHELRTPLHGILSYASLGIDNIDVITKEKLLNYFNTINVSGSRLLKLLNNLLDLAKLESGKMEFHFETNDILNAVAEIKNEFHALVGDKNLELIVEQATEETKFTFDYDKIMQVIRNLLSNAIKFSPENKEITISIHKTTLNYANENHDAIGVSVSDQGVGIPAEELEQVFDKFIQSSKTKTGAGGTGLGLPICKEIVEGHRGVIYAENCAGEGAKFTLILPIDPSKFNVDNHTDDDSDSSPDNSSDPQEQLVE